MTPIIDVINKHADLLDSTVGNLLGGSKDSNLFKDPDMLERLNIIDSFK